MTARPTTPDLKASAASRATEAGRVGANELPAPVRADELLRRHPERRAVRIDGLLRDGGIMSVVAAPKVGKSWLVHDLAVSIATGGTWIGRQCARGAVLLVDNELQPDELAFRLRVVAEARGVPLDALEVHALPIRGIPTDVDVATSAIVARAKAVHAAVIILDAFYKLVPPGLDENSNADIGHVLATIDRISRESGAAVTLVHHSSKGSQAEKSVTDVGAGASALGRAVDAHVILRPHEEAGAVVVDGVARSFKDPVSTVIRFKFPLWTIDGALDPRALKGRRAGAGDRPRPTPETFAADFIGTAPVARESVIAAAVAAGMTKTAAESMIKQCLAKRFAYVHAKPVRGHPMMLSTAPPERAVLDARDLVTDYVTSNPGAKVAEIAEAVGVSARYVRTLTAGSRS